MKTIAILNYNTCQVEFLEIPSACDTSEQIEEYLFDTLDYNSDEIYYMECKKDTKINFNKVVNGRVVTVNEIDLD